MSIVSVMATDASIIVSGSLYHSSSPSATTGFTLTFSSAAPNPFEPASGSSLEFDLQVEDGGGNRVYINAVSAPDEKVRCSEFAKSNDR